MSLGGALAGGVVGTIILQTGLAASSAAGLTRIDIPFLLGTAVTPDRARARVAGYLMHGAMGIAFALAYEALFTVTGAGVGVGALVGLLHGLVAGTFLVNVLLPTVHPRMATTLTAADGSPLIEPPGFLMLNYGTITPAVSLVLHVIYGMTVGGLAAL